MKKEDVIQAACKACGVHPSDIMKRTRKQSVSDARAIALKIMLDNRVSYSIEDAATSVNLLKRGAYKAIGRFTALNDHCPPFRHCYHEALSLLH